MYFCDFGLKQMLTILSINIASTQNVVMLWEKLMFTCPLVAVF